MRIRRRRKLRHWIPWIAAALVVGVIGITFVRTIGRSDFVAIASRLRQGDPRNDKPKDPLVALAVLDRLIEDDPRNYAALLERARAWADLKAWDNAVVALQAAADSSDEPSRKADALSIAMDFLILADPPRFDEAVAFGSTTVELQPDEPLRGLRLGATYYKGSLAAQSQVTLRFVDPVQKSVHHVEIETRVEAFVTGIWSSPDIDGLLDWLMPNGDAIVRQIVSEQLATARERFRLAFETLADYGQFGGFDASVARCWCQALYRSGRLYEAFIEAGMALREPALNIGSRRDFMEVQALCSEAIGQFATAADRYSDILAAFAQQPGAPIPFVFVYTMYDLRVKAEQWDWILEHVTEDSVLYGNDAMLRYASASALQAQGRTAEAREAILDPYSAVSLGTKNLSPISLRSSPQRRRAIAMLAYRLFEATGDSRASGALDAVLTQNPDDVEALRLRCNLALADGRNDAAVQDAFALLTPNRRDRADFQLWLDAADALSRQRYGSTLAARAESKVNQSEKWQRESDDASFVTYSTLSARRKPGRQAVLPDQLYVPSDPAFSFAIVEDLVGRNNVARTRNELRKLSDDYPDVQEFRYRLGRILVREGQFESALAEFRRLLREVPSDTELLDLAIRSELALGRQQEAATLVNQSILDDPLGVGAVRYGQRLVEQGKADQAEKLIERLVRWTDFGQRTDVLVLAARVQLALGNLPEAEAILVNLAAQAPDNVEVALLGLDIGAALGVRGLIDGSVAVLRPLAPELFPDQLQQIASRLLQRKLYVDTLEIFDATVRELPAARQSLRAVIEACKAVGRFEEADELLGLLVGDDRDALLDRFLLLALRGERDEAARRLRLDPVPSDDRPTADLLLLLGNAMLEIPVLTDPDPGARLRQLRVDERCGEAGLQLMDAIARIMPARRRLADVRPASVVQAPKETYPDAGRDVAALVALAERDADAARDLCRDLLYLLLLGDRPFWSREVQLLAEHALSLEPSLALPTRVLAARDLAAGRPHDALVRLQPLLLTQTPDTTDLALFMQAAHDFDHAEWGVAIALHYADVPAVQQLLGETLLAWGHAEEARSVFATLASGAPENAAAQRGWIAAMTATRQHGEAVPIIDRALESFPDDMELAETCAAALAVMPRPTPRAVELMAWLADRHDTLLNLDEALARAQSGDAAAVSKTLSRLIERVHAQRVAPSSEAAQLHGIVLVRSAITAHKHELSALARQLNNLALQVEPGAISLYRELAYLAQEEGELDTARRYLEVLSFIDMNDREAAMDLATLDFQQLGQPVRAADVVRRTYGSGMPPAAVEIVAAEACLLGRPLDAITAFYAVQHSPLVTADTFLTVARIAFASGLDEIAKPLFTLVVSSLPEGDPRRARPQWLLNRHLKDVVPPKRPPQPAEISADTAADAAAVAPPAEAAVSSPGP